MSSCDYSEVTTVFLHSYSHTIQSPCYAVLINLLNCSDGWESPGSSTDVSCTDWLDCNKTWRLGDSCTARRHVVKASHGVCR